MANRDLLKEAIADAKAVKETAIANAKAALEEAFAPRMQELLKAKLEEMDRDIEEAEEVTEEELEETYEVNEDDYMEENMDVEEAEETNEEVDLEELLRELDELEEEDSVMEGEDLINNPKTETAHGNVAEADEEEEGEEVEGEEEEIDLENMSEDDLKKFIEDVIADMVEAGELEAGEGMEGEEEDEEEDEEEVEINERKKYGGNKGDVPAAKRGDKKDTAEEEGVEDYKKKKKMEENKETINETTAVEFMNMLPAVAGGIATLIGSGVAIPAFIEKAKTGKYGPKLQKLAKAVTAAGAAASATAQNVATDSGRMVKEETTELEEAYNTIKTIKEELSEVNLFNAKLLYTNKIFKSKNLTESQKVKVLAAFDKAASVKEAKLVFETLSEGFKEKKSPVNESMLRGSASKVTGVVEKKPIMEVNDQFTRWQKLAGIK